MEEIEVSSWLTLDAVKKAADVVEIVGNLQTGHSMSVFCEIAEDDEEEDAAETEDGFQVEEESDDP